MDVCGKDVAVPVVTESLSLVMCQDPLQRGQLAAEDVASSVLPSPASTIPGVDPTEPAGGLNVAAERAKSAELMKRKLDVALREVRRYTIANQSSNQTEDGFRLVC